MRGPPLYASFDIISKLNGMLSEHGTGNGVLMPRHMAASRKESRIARTLC